MPGTIGYRPGTDAGMSSAATASNWTNQAFGNGSALVYTAGAGEAVTLVGAWGDGTGTCEIAVYEMSGSTITNRVGSAVSVSVGASSQEHTTATNIALTNGVKYTIGVRHLVGADSWNMRFVAGPGGVQMSDGAANNAALPATWSESAATDTNRTYFFAVVTTTVATEQEGFRFRNDDGSETTATWKAAQDTNVTSPLGANNRLRVLVDTIDDLGATAFTLRYKKSTDSNYIAVGTSSSGTPANNPNYVQGQNAAFTTTRSPAVTFGSAVQEGDIVYFFSTNSVAATAITDPTGWVNVLGANTIVASDAHTSCGLYHIVTAGEAGTTTFTCTNLWNATQTGNVLAAVIRDVDTASVVDNAGSTFNSGNTITPHVLAAITGTGGALLANSLVVRCVSKDGTGTYTTPGSHTQRQTNNSTSGTWMGTMDALTTANTDVAATNITPSAGDEYCSISVAFSKEQAGPNPPIYISPSANITAGGEATTAQLTPPAAGSFTTGRMWDDENGTDTIDPASGNYTELEWCLQAQSPAVNGDIYQFRVYAGTSPLDTYTVTPEWTIGTPAAPPSASIPRRPLRLTYR